MSSQSLVAGTASSIAVLPQSPAVGDFQDLFERALALFKERNPRHAARVERLGKSTTVHDLYTAVLEAKAKYEDRSEQNKARRWLTQLAKRVMLYSNIFDTFSQHHPEYVSLAWGTFKLLFVLVMNQEELVSELSKACAKIAEVLPRVELKVVTYATEEMERLVESLISSIIKLFGRVLKWYEEGRTKHALNAFLKPYKLRFQDLCDEIDNGARRVDKLAEALMQAEIRELLLLCRTLRLEQTTISGALMELKSIVQANNAISNPLIFSTHENVCNIQLAQMLSFVSFTSLPDPETALRYGSSLRRRRSRIRSSQGLPSGLPLSNENHMVIWASSSSSSFLSLKGNLHSKDDTKDFTTAILELLVTLKVPVLWAVKGKAAVSLGEDRFVQILRYLVWQALLLDTAIATAISGTFNSALFQAARTEEEWFKILQTIICRLPRIFIVIDMELLTPNIDSNISPLLVSMFYTRLQRLMDICKPTIVKVLLVSYRRQSSDTVSTLSGTVSVSVGSKKRQRLPRSVGRDLFSALRTRLEQSDSKVRSGPVI